METKDKNSSVSLPRTNNDDVDRALLFLVEQYREKFDAVEKRFEEIEKAERSFSRRIGALEQTEKALEKRVSALENFQHLTTLWSGKINDGVVSLGLDVDYFDWVVVSYNLDYAEEAYQSIWLYKDQIMNRTRAIDDNFNLGFQFVSSKRFQFWGEGGEYLIKIVGIKLGER